MTETHDAIEREIKLWIQQATEPKDKALLLILYQMNDNLTKNTNITSGIATDFHSHKSRIDAMLNRMRGGWFVLGIAFLLVQALGMFIVNGQLGTIAKEVVRNEQQGEAIIRMQAEHHEIIRRLTVIEGWHPANPRTPTER